MFRRSVEVELRQLVRNPRVGVNERPIHDDFDVGANVLELGAVGVVLYREVESRAGDGRYR